MISPSTTSAAREIVGSHSGQFAVMVFSFGLAPIFICISLAVLYLFILLQLFCRLGKTIATDEMARRLRKPRFSTYRVGARGWIPTLHPRAPNAAITALVTSSVRAVPPRSGVRTSPASVALIADRMRAAQAKYSSPGVRR